MEGDTSQIVLLSTCIYIRDAFRKPLGVNLKQTEFEISKFRDGVRKDFEHQFYCDLGVI